MTRTTIRAKNTTSVLESQILPAVEYRSVSFAFLTEDEQEHSVLDSISFHVQKNEIVSIIGPSGCGKTTALKLMAGLYTKGQLNINISGDVLVDGKDATVARKEHSIGMVFQDPVLLPWRTVRQNVALVTEIIKATRTDKIDELLQNVGLAEFAAMYPSQLSGGMKQRVAIARAVITKPSLLLLDEPFSALDEITRENFDLYLTTLQRQLMMTMVLVTHNLAEAVFISDRIIQLSARPARIVAEHLVPLSRPRMRESLSDPGFGEALDKIRRSWIDAQSEWRY